MLYRIFHCTPVIYAHERETFIQPVINRNNRNSQIFQGIDIRLAQPYRKKYDSVHLTLAQITDAVLLQRKIPVRQNQINKKTFFLCPGFNRINQFREKVITQIKTHNADCHGASLCQTPPRMIGVVIQNFSGLQYFLFCFLTDSRTIIKRPVYRAHGNFAILCYIFDCRSHLVTMSHQGHLHLIAVSYPIAFLLFVFLLIVCVNVLCYVVYYIVFRAKIYWYYSQKLNIFFRQNFILYISVFTVDFSFTSIV